MTTGPRMSLASITSTRQQNRPIRIALFGVPGVGKSTFAAQAPNPIFLCAEDGAGFLDAQAFPKVLSWQDALDAIEVLLREEHPFKTLVIDTLDALESLCWEHVCRMHGNGKTRSIEDFGYGRGYQHAVETWEQLLRRLEQLQAKRGMHLVLIAHAVARDHKDPDHDAWKRWTMKLHSKSADVIAGWVDAVLFAAPEMVAKKEGLKTRGFATGERLLYTQAAGSHEGKNRYGLPPSMPLDWSTFQAAVAAALAPPRPALSPEERERRLGLLRTDLATLVPQLPVDAAQRAQAAIGQAGDDLDQLTKILRRVEKTLETSSN
ncbi:MAG: ATP-binding protein [Polyangiaceae bacterium]|nr:ATP-binding protein [Polyangiaceae bacterium]